MDDYDVYYLCQPGYGDGREIIDDLLTIQQCAVFLNRARRVVQEAVQDGRLPHTVHHGRKLVKRSDLDAYRQRTQPDGERHVGRPKK